MALPFSLSRASELASTADAFESGSWSVAVYGQHVETEPVFETSAGSGIQIPLSGGGSATVFPGTTSEIEMEAEYDAKTAALTIRPRDGLHYRIKIGQVEDYQLTFASRTVDNQFRSESNGLLWGIGARANLTQGTIVSTAFALDFGFTQMIVDFDRFQSGSAVSAANHKLVHDEYQFSVNVSRRFWDLEPYGGIKFARLISKLKDETTKERTRGESDTVSPFLGLSWQMFNKEHLFVEGSFLDEESLTAGVKIQF